MKTKNIFSAFLILFLGMTISACPKKKTEPPPAPPVTQAPNGEQAQAQGTADTAKAPETKPETQPETAPAGDCTYSTDPKSVTLQWTAFKFTEKTPVKGSFTTAPVQGPTSAKSLKALAEGLRMDIDSSSLETGDPGRNVTLKDFFFGKFNPPFKMEAVAKDLSGSDASGNITLAITMNGVTKEVPFAYTATDQGEMSAKAEINMMDWQLKTAFDSIHQACETLHTGKDGVSKTWDTVDLEIKGKFTKTCGSATPPAQTP